MFRLNYPLNIKLIRLCQNYVKLFCLIENDLIEIASTK